MISDLEEHEDESDRAVEAFGLKNINDLGPPELPKMKDASFGDDIEEVKLVNSYRAQPKQTQ